MLAPYRVLDLTDERGQLAGMILAALGAEVILVEPPGGSRSRSLGPWAGDVSLPHWSYNRGKESVVLDLAGSEADRERLRDLAKGADVLIESAEPGEMAAMGLAYDDLAAVNPALVHVSITAFGSTGPKANWSATDLTVWASAMSLVISGDADRAPVRVSLPQAFLHAAGDAADGALIALWERARSGRGQHVDISAQASSLQATQSAVLAAPLRSTVPQRMAGGVRVGPLEVQLVWPCADGFVAVTFLFGAAAGPFTRRFMEWMHEEGFCDAETRDIDWIDYGTLLLTGQLPEGHYDDMKALVGRFTSTRTKQELLDEAIRRRLLIAPIMTTEDVVTSPQLAGRDYWDSIDDSEMPVSPVTAPGPIAKLSATPLLTLGRPPRLDEHGDRHRSAEARVPAGVPAPGPVADDLPLSGVKILDFMWVMAGPAITRVLTDFGATVVRVESATRVETARTITPFLDDIPEPERAGLFYNMNAGKLGLGLNLANPASREVVHDLVRWADVVCESFSPKAMRGWGCGYEDLRAINPSIVMMSTSLMGQTGPWSSFAGFGTLGAAIAGFFNIAGWPDRWPAGPFGAYTDYVSPRLGIAVLMAALDHRRRTGEGQYIDLSQSESSVHFLAPAILDYTVNGHVFERHGNRDVNMAPHGIYPAAGDDAWVAVTCATDGQWRSLAELVGRRDLASLSLSDRLARTDEVDRLVGRWTAAFSPTDVADRCRAKGVPAHAVQSSAECAADPQLAARGHFVEVEHQTMGPVTVEGPRILLSRTPGRVASGPPALGQHSWEVLSEILGYDEDRIADLYALEVIE
jgi:crotonobetainyl-CoA:carnitine CoA-transferase CaiB-like acyl-CoA transferase